MPGIQLAVARYFVCESECSPKLELLPHEIFSLKPTLRTYMHTHVPTPSSLIIPLHSLEWNKIEKYNGVVTRDI